MMKSRGKYDAIPGSIGNLAGSTVIRVLTLLASLVPVAWLAGIRVNLSASLPTGVYVATDSPPARGALALACLPPAVARLADERGYVPRGGPCRRGLMPIGKKIVAIPGDTVAITPAGLVVNGVRIAGSQPLERDSRGRPLNGVPRGTYVVGSAELWLVSSRSTRSFDSRYFGALNITDVQRQLLPLWIR